MHRPLTCRDLGGVTLPEGQLATPALGRARLGAAGLGDVRRARLGGRFGRAGAACTGLACLGGSQGRTRQGSTCEGGYRGGPTLLFLPGSGAGVVSRNRLRLV